LRWLAIPALRALLFQREPSGLYQPRCQAVKALAALEAYDVLIEYLNAPRAIADPVERVGEDAVINAAARALTGLHEARIFELLMSLSETRLLPGVIGALGRFGKVEAIPYLVEALTVQDQDAKIAVLACKISLASAMESEKDAAIRRLISLLPTVDFVLSQELEQCLEVHFDNVEKVIAAVIQAGDPAPNDGPPRRTG
jgi:HEAT repeat protein